MQRRSRRERNPHVIFGNFELNGINYSKLAERERKGGGRKRRRENGMNCDRVIIYALSYLKDTFIIGKKKNIELAGRLGRGQKKHRRTRIQLYLACRVNQCRVCFRDTRFVCDGRLIRSRTVEIYIRMLISDYFSIDGRFWILENRDCHTIEHIVLSIPTRTSIKSQRNLTRNSWQTCKSRLFIVATITRHMEVCVRVCE